MKEAFDAEDVCYNGNANNFIVELGDGGNIGGSTTYEIKYCPFCSATLKVEG